MTISRPVAVPKGGFLFCRYGTAVLVWAALLFRLEALLWLVFAVLALSALLKVRRAPMILLYSWTAGRLFRSGEEVLDETAMRFAHGLGAAFALACASWVHFSGGTRGWGLTLIFALVKSVSAAGFCPASKLYQCLGSGGCCALTGKRGC